MRTLLAFLLLLLSLSTCGQGYSGHGQENNKSSPTNIRSTRSSFAEAIKNRDTTTLFESAFELMLYYKNKNDFDSTYFFNEHLIEIAPKLGETKVYIDAQKNNHFIDRQLKGGANTAKGRLKVIRPYLENINTPLSSKYDIAVLFASHFSYTSELDSAIFYQRKALRISEKIGNGHKQKVSAHIELAKTLEIKYRPAEALNYLTNIEHLLETGNYSSMLKFRFYKTICQTLLSMGEPDKAQDYLEKIEALFEEYGYKSFKASIYKLKGRISSEKGLIEDAIDNHLKALGSIKENNLNASKPSIWSNLAGEYFKLDDLKNMKIYMDSLSLNFENLLERNKIHFHLNNVKYQLRKANTDEAFSSLKFINVYEANPSVDVLSIAKVNLLYYQHTGNLTEELKAYKKYTPLKDSLSKLANIALANRIEAEYNREKQDLKILGLTETTNAQDKALAVRNSALTIGSIMLLIMAALFYFLYNLYKKNQFQTEKITKALADNQLLIKEIHHRVKNNLQVVSSLLSMQERKVDDEQTKEALRSSKTRVHTMSLIHKSLYQKDDVRSVDVQSYFNQLTENLVASFSIHPIDLTVDVDPLQIDIDSLVPLGLVANELICNALKHGIQNKQEGELIVLLKDRGSNVELSIEDNGGNFKGDKLIRKEGSLGTRLIEAFTRNLEGDLKVEAGKTTKVSLFVNKSNLNIIDSE